MAGDETNGLLIQSNSINNKHEYLLGRVSVDKWDLVQIIESTLTFFSLSICCTYVLCKVKCSLQASSYITIAAIAICQLFRIVEDSLNFFDPDSNLTHRYSIYLFVISEFGYYTILLYYTY